MTNYSIRGQGRNNAEQAIFNRKNFKTSGSVQGSQASLGYVGMLSGEARDAYYADVNVADYTLYSYSTPIAWHTPNGWTVVKAKFSSTTGRHQSLARAGIGYNTPTREV